MLCLLVKSCTTLGRGLDKLDAFYKVYYANCICNARLFIVFFLPQFLQKMVCAVFTDHLRFGGKDSLFFYRQGVFKS